MTISRTPEYQAYLDKRVAEHGPYVAFATLLGGPDHNRRTIQNILTEERLDVFNANMGPWTIDMQEALDARLAELNGAYLAKHGEKE